MASDFIALDWGTTSFRAYRVSATGHVHDTISAPQGILAVKDGAFEAALESLIGAWDVALPVMAAGMITSRQGWIELPYLPCPASAADLARALHMHTTASGRRMVTPQPQLALGQTERLLRNNPSKASRPLGVSAMVCFQ